MGCSFPIWQLKGTVILKIWWQVAIIALWSSGIVLVHLHVPSINVTFPMTLVPILGVATGMLLVFRTNTAYDRYWEARKTWSSMTTSIRNLTRNIWVGIKENDDSEASIVLVEKVSALNLLAAFSYATRNYLRQEYSYEDADLKQLLRHVPKFYSFECKCPKTTKKQNAGNNGKKPLAEEMEAVGSSPWCETCYSTPKTYRFISYDEDTPTNIPMELSYLLAAYIKNANGRNLIDPSLLAAINNALNALVDCLTSFERILRTPIPLAYSVHLHHATWIYLLTLPSQLVLGLNWWTVGATSLATFCLLGVLETGWEIENPFGTDPNDLPLDDYCRVTHREIQKIMGRKVPSTDVWLMSQRNRPLAPDCMMNAPDLVNLPIDDLRTLVKRDPMLTKSYFDNLAYSHDEDTEKKQDAKPEIDVESGVPDLEVKKGSITTLNESVEDEQDSVDMDLSAKRVSFVLPSDEDEDEESKKKTEEQDEEEEVEDEEEEEEEEEEKEDDEEVEEEEDEEEDEVEEKQKEKPPMKK